MARYLRRMRRRGDSAKLWLAFRQNHREVITAFDFFTVPTVTFQLLYCFFVIEHGRRRILHFNVTRHPTAEWVVQQLREAFPEKGPYRYAIFDRDPTFNDEVVTGKRVGAAPQARGCFSGGTGTGEPEPERCESKAEASQTPGAAKAPKQCRDKWAVQETRPNGSPLCRSQPPEERHNPNHRRIASPSWTLTPVFPEWQCKGRGNREARDSPAKMTRRRHTQTANETQPRSHPGKQDHRRKSTAGQTRNTSVTPPRRTAADARKYLIPSAHSVLATHNRPQLTVAPLSTFVPASDRRQCHCYRSRLDGAAAGQGVR